MEDKVSNDVQNKFSGWKKTKIIFTRRKVESVDEQKCRLMAQMEK